MAPRLGPVSTSTATGAPAGRDGPARLWIPAPSRASAADHRAPGVRAADITDVIAMSLPQELRPIARGLSLGRPDATLSRLLDMSPRTFSRRVAELLAYLEVETRFQAGLEVAHRWTVGMQQQRSPS
jgi:DNA-binding NarL/FixJ family response regulator